LENQLDIKCIDQTEFDGLEKEWNQLLARSSADNVFLRWEWMHTWWDVFRKNRRLLVITARSDGKLAAIAPFYIDRSGPLRTKTLRFCSDELCPDYLDIIAEKAHESEAVNAICAFLQKDHRNDWDMMALENLRSDSKLPANPMLLNHHNHHTQHSFVCSYIKINGSFDNYWSARPSLRSELSRQQRKLFNEKRIRHVPIRDEQILAKAMEDLFFLHAKRVKDKNIVSRFTAADVRRFHQTLAPALLKNGILNLHLIYHGDSPVSAIYCFNYNNKVYFFQSGFDPHWGKRSVGSVLLRLVIREAFEKRFEEFDFLKGDEGYKTFWTNASRRESELIIYNQTFRGAFGHAMKIMKARIRHLTNIREDSGAPVGLEKAIGAPRHP
jgi:CelD/BcsL family acetyltransferase involved in cellulose biosynthesis